MPNSYHSLIQRKSIKQIKLGFFAAWRLKRCGERDCKKKIVRQREDGKFSSPFLKQEISLCMAAILTEKEILTKILMGVDADITATEYRIERIKDGIGEIQNSIPENVYNDKVSNKEKADSSVITTEIIENYQGRELKARISTKTKQMDDLNKSIINNKIRKEQKQHYAENEVEIMKIRCLQLYELLKARLSAYWSGVLKADASTGGIPMPPILDVDDLTREIETEIESFVRRKKHDEGSFPKD